MSEDKAGKGFVRHRWGGTCRHGHGERDEPEKPQLQLQVDLPVEFPPAPTANPGKGLPNDEEWQRLMAEFGHRFRAK